MDFVKLLLREAPEAWRRALFVAGLAGVASAAILAIINRAAELALDQGSVSARLLALFALCIATFYFGKRYALIQASVIVEHMVRNRLVRVADKIRRSELEVIENLGRGELYTKLARDTSLVSQSGIILVNAAQQSFVLVFCLIYIGFLSKLALIATLIAMAAGMAIYFNHARMLQMLIRQISVADARLVDTLGHMVDGFKEIRLNRRKNDAVFAEFGRISENSRNLKIDGQVAFCVDIMFSDLFFYLLLAVVVFIIPRLVPTYADVVLMTTASILFIIGPLQMVVQATPVIERAKAALLSLEELETRLDAMVSDRAESSTSIPDFRKFQTLSLEQAKFAYGAFAGEQGGFTVGPITLSIRRGETLFLVGGNGSGKTTLLKMLTGLYVPASGQIAIDGTGVSGTSVQGYRELFSTVFSQFHLFDQLYGLDNVDEQRVRDVLEELQLAEKTSFAEGRFTTLNLSTGQRKRLGLAVCLLEDRDVMVFDEWAADQDPHFRRYFYEDVLPRLKAQGKTIIAATHDDRYWHLADRVIRLEYGLIADETRHN